MTSPQFNIDTFVRRLKTVYASWQDAKEAPWSGVHGFAVATPPPSDDMRYLKSTTLQIWLLGYEFPETVMLFLPRALHVICSPKKAGHLIEVSKACKEKAGIEMVLHSKPKNEDGAAQMKAALEALRSSAEGQHPIRLGQLSKEAPDGAVMATWASVCAASGFELVDVANALCDVFAAKEDAEVLNIKKAAFLGAQVLKNFVVERLESIIDEERSVSHEKLMEQTEEVITEPSKLKIKLKDENCDICYPPVFQSGGKFDLKASALSNEEPLCYSKGGVILCSIGARYDSYCSNIARSYLIEASPQQQKAYEVLLKAHDAAIAAIRPGQKLSEVYKAAVGVVEKEAPELAPHLTKNAGTGIGIEFRESGLALNPKNERVVRRGMVFNVSLGLQGLKNVHSEDPKTKEYALLLADTVVVKPGEGAGQSDKAVEVATHSCPKAFSVVGYSLKNEDDEEEEEEEKQRPSTRHKAAASAGHGTGGIFQTHLRSEAQEATKEQIRRQNQADLAKLNLEETARRLAAGGALQPQGDGGRRAGREANAYREMSEIPAPQSREPAIQVDQRHEAVLLPIYGLHVPFHISLIKTVSAQVEGGQAYIRVIFNVPGAGLSASDFPMLNFPHSVFVKEVSFRSMDVRHANESVQRMKALSKQLKQRASEEAERATLVSQEKLQLARGRPPRLPDLDIRPTLGSSRGKKTSGVLEAHINGFRYMTNRADERLDVMYENIKHAFFQPAGKKDMAARLHFHLFNPIMVGKKKTKDVQCFTQVVEEVQSVGAASRRSAYDPDEIEEEQRETERRNKINTEFEKFVNFVQEQVWEKEPRCQKRNLEFDLPFPDLGFSGVPAKSTVFILPTVNCLVELTEPPFFVITLNEIEIVNLERIGGKSFDLAIVFKNFRRDVIRIDAIPSKALDAVKEWLNSMNIKYYESRMNLNWKPILENILADPGSFLAEGGWEFLNLEGGDSEGSEEEEEDAYEPSDVDEVSEEEEEGDDEDDESVVDSEEEDEEEEEEEGEEEEGLTWDELEAKAAKEDGLKGSESDSEEERRRRRKGGGGGSGSKPGRHGLAQSGSGNRGRSPGRGPSPSTAARPAAASARPGGTSSARPGGTSSGRPGGSQGNRPGGGGLSSGRPVPGGGRGSMPGSNANRPRPSSGPPPKRSKF